MIARPRSHRDHTRDHTRDCAEITPEITPRSRPRLRRGCAWCSRGDDHLRIVNVVDPLCVERPPTVSDAPPYLIHRLRGAVRALKESAGALVHVNASCRPRVSMPSTCQHACRPRVNMPVRCARPCECACGRVDRRGDSTSAQRRRRARLRIRRRRARRVAPCRRYRRGGVNDNKSVTTTTAASRQQQ